jgi:predicted transcriptional regulator
MNYAQDPRVVMRATMKPKNEREDERRQAREDVLAAWKDYQASGQHVSDEEADAWLARLEAGEDVPPPACRD